VDWTRIFTPIEKASWEEIRYNQLPFYPQFPIGRFFADFACPSKKICIECDGRAYHSAEKDRPRDLEMSDAGWVVYRISGADCKRILPHPSEAIADLDIEQDSDKAMSIVSNWLGTTVDGLIAAVSFIHFNKPCSESWREAASYVLRCRRGVHQ
jgi:very-short-patch-repair endonuclease